MCRIFFGALGLQTAFYGRKTISDRVDLGRRTRESLLQLEQSPADWLGVFRACAIDILGRNPVAGGCWFSSLLAGGFSVLGARRQAWNIG